MMQVKTMISYGVVALVGLGVAGFVYKKSHADYEAALARYMEVSRNEDGQVVAKMEGVMRQVYQNLRTISLLPSVQKIDRHATNLDQDGLFSIQQIYNNLATNVQMSEVYLIPADLDPDAIDPVTGKAMEPIKMFDAVMMDPANPPAEEEEPAEVGKELAVEEEIYEYRQLRDTMKFLAEKYPTKAGIDMLKLPVVAGVPVITCDNTEYEASRVDEDRKGLMISVPFFGENGKFKGAITGIVRNNVLRGMLPEQNYALVHTGYGVVLDSLKEGQHRESAAFVAAGKPDTNLIFSEVHELGLPDPNGEWVVWAGRPNSEFLESADVWAVKQFEYGGYALALLLVGVGVMVVRRQEKFARVDALTKTFESTARSVVSKVVELGGQMQLGIERVSGIAGETRTRSATVAAASGQAADSSGQIASAAEELSASIADVRNHTHRSREVAETAAEKAREAKDAIVAMSEKSHQVGDVIDLITGIAGQINLLALNASIEAARAGEAGRGFAVVADEVKKLATQVTQAAEQITAQIHDMQGATEASVKVVGEVMSTMQQVTESATVIAATIEEQSKATADIVQHISQTAHGSQEISKNIQAVLDGAENTGATAEDVLRSAHVLAEQSQTLRQQVDTFFNGIRS